MASGALAEVNGLGAALVVVLKERCCPSHLVGVHINDVGLRVHGWASPFGRAVETGKDHGFSADAEWNELALVNRGFKFFERPLVCFGRASGEHVFGQGLSRVGRW